ncbi:MAG: hypothetical protein IID40_05430, partial [Planctomycetes bacterium]|nr:hypothetical protein [Planctomycetota bacterium]
MPAEVESNERANWLTSSSFVQIFRTFGLAVHPTKLLLALAALVLTVVWGAALDSIWTRADRGVPVNAVWRYVGSAGASAVPEGTSTTGIFNAWRQFESRCARSAVASAARGNLWSGGLNAALPMIGHQVAGAEQVSLPPAAPNGLIP